MPEALGHGGDVTAAGEIENATVADLHFQLHAVLDRQLHGQRQLVFAAWRERNIAAGREDAWSETPAIHADELGGSKVLVGRFLDDVGEEPSGSDNARCEGAYTFLTNVAVAHE